MTENDRQSDWPQHKMLVMDRLERLEHQQQNTQQQVQSLSQDTLALQYEAAMYGTFAGLVPTLVFLVIAYLKFHNKIKDN
ncbi:hypothetical protein QSV34_10600 [Porticoccus sp. W117]|uniref:hypothetical protein n=1 Tax=Porticoccus sp. W117 TaxID=3054777 RepID=UPI0025997558|nr:hypothetical protein [Porticoccus sp. W117]MDM3871800.1 hypothetical protein [Porticoccus sp. W117]